MKNLKSITGKFICLVLLSIPGFAAIAQTSPAGHRAIGKIKVDGVANDWDANWQEYNKGTYLYYTVCNDNDNLYFLLRSKDLVNNKKIISGGITLTINPSGNKKDTNAAFITFPLFSTASYGDILSDINRLDYKKNTPYQADSVNALANKTIKIEGNEIKVKGISGKTDTLLSVYNTNGIKAMMQVDKEYALVCEFALPLKLLGISAGAAGPLKYNVKVNGIGCRVTFHQVSGSNVSVANVPHGAANEQTFQSLNSVTDFWGEYILAVKP